MLLRSIPLEAGADGTGEGDLCCTAECAVRTMYGFFRPIQSLTRLESKASLGGEGDGIWIVLITPKRAPARHPIQFARPRPKPQFLLPSTQSKVQPKAL